MARANAQTLVAVALVWQLLAMSPAAVTADDCIRYYHELETSLVENSLNLDSLTQGFFPPNEPSVPVVEVFYTISNSTDLLAAHPLALESQGINETGPNVLATYRYRWSDSPIFLFMDPNLLEKLSLSTIILRYHAVQLVVDPICEDSTINGEPLPVYLLNQLTAHLKTYAVKGVKAGPLVDVQGYVSYFDESESEFIVIDFHRSFHKSMILLVVGLIALAIFTTIATPLVLHVKYDYMYRLAQKEHANHLFVIWAGVMTCFIATAIIVTVDVYFLVKRFSIPGPLLWPAYIAMASCVIFVPIDLILAIFVKKRKDFPLPHVMKIICFDTGLCFKGSVIIQTLAMWVVIVFVNVVSFHLTFIFLAFVASPIQTGSAFLLYATGVFSTISITTLFLATVQNNFSLDMTDTQKKRFVRSFCVRSLRLIPFLSLLIFTVFFATCFVRVTIYVGDYQSGGIPSLFASLAPAILLGTLGFVGRHVLVKYVPRRSAAGQLPTTSSDLKEDI